MSFTLGAAYRFDNAVSGLAGFQIQVTVYLLGMPMTTIQMDWVDIIVVPMKPL